MSDAEKKSEALLAAHIRAKFKKHAEIVNRLSDAQLIEKSHTFHAEKIAQIK